jgi:hypothetical protein
LSRVATLAVRCGCNNDMASCGDVGGFHVDEYE